MATADVLRALQLLLRASPQVWALTEGRVWRTQLPDEETRAMGHLKHARANVVIARAGGRPNRSYLRLAYPRIDLRAYGRNQGEAFALWAAVDEVFLGLERRVLDGCMLFSVTADMESIDLFEPEAGWPLQYQSYTVLYSKEPAVAPV